MLREARVILPEVLDGHNEAHDKYIPYTVFENEIAKAYGGFTLTRGQGYMNGYGTERVRIYDIALEGDDFGFLFSVATVVGKVLGQDNVYVRTTDGNVHLVPMK